MNEEMEVDDPPPAEKAPETPKEEAESPQKAGGSGVVIVLDDDEQPDIIDLVGQTPVGDRKCINYQCQSGVELFTPPIFCMSFYRVTNESSKSQKVCRKCYDAAVKYYDSLCTNMLEGGDLLDVDYPVRNDTLAIDDSDSDGEDEKEPDVMLDEGTFSMLEEKLDDVMEEIGGRVDYNAKLDESIKHLEKNYQANNDSFLEVKTMIDSIRKELDTMLFGLFGRLRVNNKSLPELIIPGDDPSVPNPIVADDKKDVKKEDIKPVEIKKEEQQELMKPPNDLPPRGPLVKPPIKIGMSCYAARNQNSSSWVRVKVESVVEPPGKVNNVEVTSTTFYVSREYNKVTKRYVTGKELAYSKPLDVALEVGTRVIALFLEYGDVKISRRDAYYPGVVGESPSQYNRYRYLIFFDDGYAYYVHYRHVFVIYESSKNVWEDVRADSQAFIKKYVTEYPNRSMVKLTKNQTIRTEFRGKWYVTTVINIDCSLVQMYFDSQNRSEWIYRGSRRLNTMYKEEQAANNRLLNKHRIVRAGTGSTIGNKAPYVQYMRDDPDVIFVDNSSATTAAEEEKSNQQRSVAKKSTRPPMPAPNGAPIPSKSFLPPKPDGPPGKIVYYTPRKQTPNATPFRPHRCNNSCHKDVNTPLARLKGYGPMAKPLLCGFYRIHYKLKYKKQHVVYKTPCGRTVRNYEELHRYLFDTKCQLTVDLFNFDPSVRCLAEFILEPNNPIIKDLSQGTEEIQIPVVNYVDNELNDFVNYSTKRTPMEGVHLNLDPEFLVGCDCVDDCVDRKKCSCWQLTLEGLKYLDVKDENEVGYQHRRLFEPIFTGIYECNSRCKCSKTCLNRVVQNPMQHKLQVFKTPNRGWGIRCINDIPQGSFICIYAGALLTEQMANEGGKRSGDEYLAELDYIEIVESTKEGYEDEVAESEEERERDSIPEEEEEEKREPTVSRRKSKAGPMEDQDFVPHLPVKTGSSTSIRTRLRKREITDIEDKMNNVSVKKTTSQMQSRKSSSADDEGSVVISDDEDDAREPSSFNPQTEDDDDDDRKYPSVRAMFGKDERVYIMDAKNTGNIGRYLNHSCSPNVFVQNVFVDTHDLRFPWVSFFAMSLIRAGTELTWNYNYDIGSVEGKIMYCMCGSSECKGRLL